MKDKQQKYSIRKFSVGVSSIVIASLFFIGAGTASADESQQAIQGNDNKTETTSPDQNNRAKVDEGQQNNADDTTVHNKENGTNTNNSIDVANEHNAQTKQVQESRETEANNKSIDDKKKEANEDISQQESQQASSKNDLSKEQQTSDDDNSQTTAQTDDNDAKEQVVNKATQSEDNRTSNKENQQTTKNNDSDDDNKNTAETALHNSKKDKPNDVEEPSNKQQGIENEQDLYNKTDELNASTQKTTKNKQDAINDQTTVATQQEKETSLNASNKNKVAHQSENINDNKVTEHDEGTSTATSNKQDSASYDSIEKLATEKTANHKDDKAPTDGIKSLKNNAVATTNTKTAQRESENVTDQPGKKAKQGEYKNQDPIILVHGFNGFTDDKNPIVLSHYWGGDKLNITQDLEQNGYKAYEASIGALSSNYDRAVELYYYIKGGRVDYGAAHAAKYGHERYGHTYEGVYKDWQPGQKVHLVGHSMGGQTVRQLEELLRNGNQEEIDYQKEHGGTISPLYQGDHDNMISSITTLGTPHNGTHAADELGNEAIVRQAIYDFVKLRSNKLTNVNFGLDQWGFKQRPDETFIDYVKRVKEMSKLWTTKDNALYDLTREGATELNRQTSINPNIVYKTYTGEATHTSLLGRQRADLNLYLPFALTSNVIGKAKEKDWRENDGLVSVVSSQHPFNQPYTDATDKVQKGVWQVTPVRHGWDHVDFVGQDTLDATHSRKELQDFWHNLAADLVRDEQVT
ncbi:YSIRK domain-containing triacylglycerol lipase GehC [Helicobacter pylori]